jgi:hypothetical protein
MAIACKEMGKGVSIFITRVMTLKINEILYYIMQSGQKGNDLQYAMDTFQTMILTG